MNDALNESEKKVKESIEICIANGRSIIDIYGNTRITERQCQRLASEYPIHYMEIKRIFGFRTGEQS